MTNAVARGIMRALGAACKVFGVLLALIAVAGVAAWLYLTHSSADGPAIATYERSSGHPLTQEVVFSTPCDPGGPHLYVEREGGHQPLYLRLPAGLRDPEESDYAVPGNRFVLEGYPVTRKSDGKVLSTRYFDVLSWKPIPPYDVWGRIGPKLIRKRLSTPVEFRTSEPAPTFEPVHYSGAC